MILSVLTIFLLSNCKKETEEIDTTYPEIIASSTAFPQQCSTIKRGESFTFKTRVSDNVELGSMSIDIHHNFDHHSHSTEVNSCNMEAVKSPVKPYLLIREISIPAGQKNYEATASINVPADIDPGDYHFLIRITDKAGWQTIKGISIKIN
ncbi:MAG: DUF4625 domain-containing protein [Pedobacter sp.]|nr:MAG: DUF4625 domain-containing protein [Pedobacter sp.]